MSTNSATWKAAEIHYMHVFQKCLSELLSQASSLFIAVGYKTKKSCETNFKSKKSWFNNMNFITSLDVVCLAIKMPRKIGLSIFLYTFGRRKGSEKEYSL